MIKYDGWRVLVIGRSADVCGAGVLIAPDLVLTCAHVVAKALGAAKGGPRPVGSMPIKFATSMDAIGYKAEVHENGWVPVAADQTGDLAVLRLNKPAPVEPATLDHCGPPSGRSVAAFGHPGGEPLGRWAKAELSGTTGPTGEWVQLFDPRTTGHRVEPGYSGAGVQDLSTGRVIGIVIGSDGQAAVKGAWMIAMEAVVARLPLVASLLGAVSAAQRSLDPLDPARAEYEHALVDLLSGLDGVESRSHRDDLIAAIERGLGEPIPFTRNDRSRTDLMNLVVACLDHPHGGVLSALIQAVRLLHGDAPRSQRLALLVAQDPGRRLTPEEVRRLGALLSNLPADLVHAAAGTAFGVVGQPHDIDPHDDAALVRSLLQLTGRAGYAPPLLRFLLRLANGSGEPVTAELREWIGVLARRWQIPADELARDDDGQLAPEPAHSYLVVELREDGVSSDLFHLSIWLQHDTGAGFALLVRDEQPLTLDEIPGHVGEHLRRVDERQVGPTGSLVVEFVLPFRLLGQPVDQFQVMLKGTRRILGAAFPVVVRSLDRMRNEPLWHRWQTRWNWLKDHQHRHHPQAMKWVRLHSTALRSLEDELRRTPSDYTEQVPVCLVLAARGRREGVPDAVPDAVNLGIPVLLWCRERTLMEQFLVDMANLLNGRTVAEIPAAVRALRSQAETSVRRSSTTDLGSHICLLWDDMDRHLPKHVLQAPA